MNDRQRLEAIVDVVVRYLPPHGIPIKDAMSEIIKLVDPLPDLPKRDNFEITAKTESGTSVQGNIQLIYVCKSCGHKNELLRLSASSVAIIPEKETHESLCHKCDDTEIIILETKLRKNT